MARITGRFATSKTLGESVQAFIPAVLPPAEPSLALESYSALNHIAELALVHAQFETIHPFLDGNGRIGRLLIAALLESWGLLNESLMYLSGYLKEHQAEYYKRLSAIGTEGDWESWILFFLEGIVTASANAEKEIVTTASLVTLDRKRLMSSSNAGAASYRLFEHLPMMPRFTVESVRQLVHTSFPTANAAVKVLEELGIVTETTGLKTNRQYSYGAYIDALTS